MGRLKKAIEAKFFLEAVFIEYAVMEDRLESIIRQSGEWTFQKDRTKVKISEKMKKMKKIVGENSLAQKYFTAELLSEIESWKGDRNTYIHDFMIQKVTTADLEKFALQGWEIVKKLNSASTSYKRALQKQNEKNTPKK